MFQGNIESVFGGNSSSSGGDLISQYKQDNNSGGGSPFDALSLNTGGSSFETNKTSQESVFQQKGAFMQEDSIASDLNVRAQRYGQMSVLDKMRGIQANKLNTEEDSVSIAESYADSALDKRVMNGLYNTTITDLYADRTKYEAFHGLITDGKVEERENAMIDSEIGTSAQSNFSGTLIGGYQTIKESKEESTHKISKEESIVKQQELPFEISKEESSFKQTSPFEKQNPFNYSKEETNPFEQKSPYEKTNETQSSKYKKTEEEEEEKKKEKKLKESIITQSNYQEEEDDEDTEFKESIGGATGSIYFLEEEETKKKKKKKVKEVFKQTAKDTFGEDDEDFTNKIAASKSGTRGIYGEQSLEINQEQEISKRIKEILNKMTLEKLEEVVTRYSLMPDKTHKDKLKLNIAQEILQKKREFNL